MPITIPKIKIPLVKGFDPELQKRLGERKISDIAAFQELPLTERRRILTEKEAFQAPDPAKLTLREVIGFKPEEKPFELKSEIERTKRLAKDMGVAFETTFKELPKSIWNLGRDLLVAGAEVPAQFPLEIAQTLGVSEGRIKIPHIGELKSLNEQYEDWKRIAQGNEAVAALGFTADNLLKVAIFASWFGYGRVARLTKVYKDAKKIAYQRLGLSETATTEEVTTAHRNLVKKFHPDVGGDPVKFKEVNQAYNYIKGTEKITAQDILKASKEVEFPATVKKKALLPPEVKPEEMKLPALKLKPTEPIITPPPEVLKPPAPPVEVKPPIPKELEPLAVEARKYKSAEEFVKKNTFYRGGKEGGNYYSTSKQFARNFTPTGRESEIIEKSILPNEIYKAKRLPSAIIESEIDNIIKIAKQKGFKAILVDEGIKQPNSIFVFDQTALKTKSQLTDFYKRAVKEVKPTPLPTIKKVLGEKPSPFIRIREMTIIKDRIRAMARATRKGNLSTRKDILKAGNELKDILKKAEVPGEDMKWFINTFKNIKGFDDFIKKLPIIEKRIARLASASEMRTLKRDIIKEIKVTKPKKGQKKALESKFGVEAQKQLDTIRKGIKGNRQEALTEIEKNINKYGIVTDGVTLEVPSEVAIKNALLNMVGIKDMSIEELRLMLANIRSLKQSGQFKILRELSNKAAELELIKDTAKKEMRPTKEVAKISGEPERHINPVERIWHSIDNALLGVPQVLEKATFSKEFTVADWADELIRAARGGHTKIGIKWSNSKAKAAKRIFGKEKIGKTFRELNREKLVYKGKDSLGKPIEIKLSQLEAAYWHALAKDPVNLQMFVKNMNFTPKIFETLDKFVKPKTKEYIKFLQEEWLEAIYNPVNQRYRVKFGMDMPKNENYIPRLYSDKPVQEEITNLLFGDAFPSHPSTVPSGVKARIGSRTEFRKISIEQVTRRHMEQMKQFIHFDEAISDLRRVFGDPEVKEVIFSQKGGKQLYNTLTKKIDDVARGGMAAQMKIAGIDFFIGNFTKASMMTPNFVPFLKQLTSFPAFTMGRGGVTYRELISGAFAYYQNPAQWTKLFAKSDFIIQRLTAGFNRETAIAFRRGNKDFFIKEINMSLGEFLHNGAIMPVRGGDMIPILPGMTAKYLQATKQLQKAGRLTKEQIHKRALLEAEKLASRTQQDPTIESVGRIQTANSVGKGISMYATTPIQFYREAIGAIRMWGRGQMNFKDMLRTVITSWIILPQLFQWVSDGFEWNEERQLRALILGPFNYYPAAGNLIGTMYDAFAHGETWKNVASAISPLFSIPEKGQRMFSSLYRIMFKEGLSDEKKKQEWWKFAKRFYEIIGLTTGKVPSTAPRNVEGIIDLVKGDTKDPRRLIFSEWALDIKEEKKGIPKIKIPKVKVDIPTIKIPKIK